MSFTRSEMKETSKGRTRDSSNHHHNHNHNHRSSSKDSRSHRDVSKGTTAINGHDHRSDRSRRDRPQVALPSSTAILKSSRPQPHHSITASITGLPIRLPSNGVKLTKKERDRIRHRIRYAEQKLAREAERMGGVSSSSKLTNGLGPGAKGAKYSGRAPLPASNGTASASNSSSTSTSQHSHHKRAHVSTAMSSSPRLNGASSTRSTMGQPMTKSAASSSPSPSTSKPYHPSRPSTSNNNMDATPPRQHPQHPTTAMKGPKTQLFPPSYLNGLESSTDMDAWLPPKYHDDEEYKAEVEAANARHSAKCLQTCTPAIYNGITDLQLLLERHCVQLEERRYQLREEKRAWSEFRRASTVKETGKIKRSKKDSAAWFLEHYKPPTRQSERPPPGPSPDSPTGIEALSRVENFFTASSSLLLTTVASCSLLGASTNLSDRAMRKVERSKRMLVVVPAPQQQAYFSGELNPLLAKLNADFERLFAEKLVLEKHYSPLAEYIGQSKFTDLVRQVLAGGKRAEETTAAEDEPVTLRCSARIRRNQSVEEMLPGSPVHPVHLRNGSSSPLKRPPPPAVLPASPSRPKNGFKVPRLNGYLGRSPHHYSTASSSLESSPGASPPSTTTEVSAPPSPTALYKDLVEFTGALTRSQIRSLQDTTRAMSSEARLVKKSRRGPSAVAKESNSTAASPEEPDPFEVIDVQLKANMKKNRDMLRLLDEHVFLFAPRCDGNAVKSRSELAKSTRGSTKSRPKSEANSKRSSLRRRADPNHSSSDSKDSTLMRPPMTPATPTPTSSPTISPSCPLTRGRKRSRTDSVDTTDQHQHQQSTFWSGFWADEEAKYDSTASRAERAVPNPTLEDELDCEGWEMSLELPRASTKHLEAILTRTAETIKESTINKCRGGREMTTVATINSPLAMVLEEGTDRRRFLPQADDPRAYLKTDPLFGLELLGDQPVSSSSRRGSLEPIECVGHEDSTEEAAAALNGQPKDELKESLQVLLSELESLTAVNTAHLGYISDQVLHDLRLQELRASAENLHVEVLDMFVGKLNRRSSNPLEPAAKRRIEEKLDELLRVKRQMDAILAAQGAKGAIAEVFQCQQSLNIAKQQQGGGT